VSTWVKVCGVTSVTAAELVLEAGADALGLNLVPASPRSIGVELARMIRDRVAGRLEVVLVVADLDRPALRALMNQLEPDWLQLHGSEAPDLLESVLPRAYKAIHVRQAQDVQVAESFLGDRILVDAKVPGKLGGTGTPFDYELTLELARRRRLILAGGLTPETVAAAVTRVKPFGVDVASGVEPHNEPRSKDPDKVAAFVRAAKGG